MGKVIAAYGGGFKPPTRGHFEIVKKALSDYPEIDEFIIYVGSKERDGIEQFESIQVWEIYKKYLANKVDIQPAKAPMKDILNLAKENPQDMIYFILGFRDGRDDDMKDIEARSKLEEKYPNLVVKTIGTADANMSGTNARKAIADEEEFIKFLPDEVEEKSEIWSIIRPAINEEDFSPLGYAKKIISGDISFRDAMKDSGISFNNLSNLLKKLDAEHLISTSYNLDNLNENATYSKKINLIDRLATLTQHMLDKGMNIEPLPKLEFIDGDTENASEFLGKTAYYDPNTQTIVLYTEGRHPKDITRSYAHEMVHHIQNLEGRLGNIQTTNTQEDDHLNDIESEANLKGTMTFRNWTDTIKEAVVGDKIECDECGWSWDIKDGGDDLYMCHKCGHDNEPINESKDYFGLKKMVKEILIVEEEVVSSPSMEYKIFSDMDGVLTDFDASFEKYSDGMPPREYEKKYGKEKFWELIDGKGKVGFWVGMPWMSDAKTYWDYIKNYDTELLSSPSRSSTSRLGKRLWVRNNMPGTKLTLAQAAKKQNYAAPNHILIDDRASNIEQWKSQGGIGILHTSAADTISQLKKLGL
jgi:phosphopantetheine adenylyltransferase|tara:strand:- start:1917 stop:3671 length:1755 start_codon:yes stop_codon:yes gene_type:complete